MRMMVLMLIKFVDILSVAFAISVVVEPICSIYFARVCFHIQRARFIWIILSFFSCDILSHLHVAFYGKIPVVPHNHSIL